MKILGINIGRFTKKPKEPPIPQSLIDDMKWIAEAIKKQESTKSDNFTKMAKMTDCYKDLPHVQKVRANPINAFLDASDELLEAVQKLEIIKEMSQKSKLPENLIVDVVQKIKKSTRHLNNLLIKPDLSDRRLQSIAKALNERFKMIEKIKI